MKHLKAAGLNGAPMSELVQVLKDRSRGHVQRLVNELRDEARTHSVGTTRAGRWYLVPPAK